jgi:hypothetical protein
MHTFIINTTLPTLCHSDLFHPLKGHLQGVRQANFNSTFNKICQIQLSEQRVTFYVAQT